MSYIVRGTPEELPLYKLLLIRTLNLSVVGSVTAPPLPDTTKVNQLFPRSSG